jgi:hypothetical protein
MTLRIWRRFHVAPGVTLNLSKTGVSTSFGPRGAHITVGRTPRVTVGAPGSGVFLTERIHVRSTSCPPGTCHAAAPADKSLHVGRHLLAAGMLGFGLGRALTGGRRGRRRR